MIRRLYFEQIKTAIGVTTESRECYIVQTLQTEVCQYIDEREDILNSHKNIGNITCNVTELFLFIWGFTSLSTLYRSYQDG